MITHMHVGFRVKNYDHWKQGYDASAEQRKASGEVSNQVYRDPEDHDFVTVISVQSKVKEFKEFINSPKLHEMMAEAGVVEMGQMCLMEEMDSGSF